MSLPPPGTNESNWLASRAARARPGKPTQPLPPRSKERPNGKLCPTPQPGAPAKPTADLRTVEFSRPQSPLIVPVRPDRTEEPTPKAKRRQPTGSSKSTATVVHPNPAIADADTQQPADTDAGTRPADRIGRQRMRFPGWQVCVVGSLLVLAAAVWSAATHGSIGPAAGVALIATTTIAAVVTRRGDLPLVVMYPPLAFTASALIAGQLLVDPDRSWPAAQTLMLVVALGSNAAWVVAATTLAVVLVGLRTWLRAARCRRRSRVEDRAATVNTSEPTSASRRGVGNGVFQESRSQNESSQAARSQKRAHRANLPQGRKLANLNSD